MIISVTLSCQRNSIQALSGEKMKWFKLTIEIPDDDFVQSVKLNGKTLCLIKHAQKMYATQHTCPHAGGILSGGWCKNGHIVCPIHRYEYNLETGRGAPGQGDYIDIFPVEKREDGYYVGLKESWWKRMFN